MDIENIIVYENESTYVDFKKSQYQNNEEFLKDIMAMANANIENSKRYIIIGVKHLPDGSREFHPIQADEFKDDSIYQELVRSNIEPEIQFRYMPLEYKGNLLGVFEITGCAHRPYIIKKQSNKLEKGTCYIRRGSQNGRAVREDLEGMYEDRYKRQRELEIKNSYLHLLRQEFRSNSWLLHRMDSFISEGPIIKELWTTANEISNHVILEAWDSLMRSGIIASLEYDEMEQYRFSVRKIRDAVFYVREASANWMRILAWNYPIFESEVEIHELKQPASPKLYLQQRVNECRQAIKIAQEAVQRSIDLLEARHVV